MGHDPGSPIATLDTGAKLGRGATYTAPVTTGAEGATGIPPDQDPNTAGNRGTVWGFGTKPRDAPFAEKQSPRRKRRGPVFPQQVGLLS